MTELRDRLLPTLEMAFQFAIDRAVTIHQEQPDLHPMFTQQGRWRHQQESWTHWCEGFYPGILWLGALRTGRADLRQAAETMTRRLEPRKLDRNVHDLGFLFLNTYKRWHKLTGEPALDDVVVQAGQTLALRFKPLGQYLCSFIGPESLFIDIMMNVPIIYYAAQRTGDADLRRIADAHCQTTADRLVHADGSCVHEGVFNTETGAFVRESTHQGYGPTTCWARGLTWALHGYSRVYHYTQNPTHLALAERIADYYLRRTPGGIVPKWDFDVPADDPTAYLYDSSAAAIAASGLWSLALQVSDPAKVDAYRTRSLETLANLCSSDFLAKDHAGQEGILLHGVYHYHKGLGVDESVSWGDHFFVEALYKVLQNTPSVEA